MAAYRDPWYIVHRARAKARMHRAIDLHVEDGHPAVVAATARFAYYCREPPGADDVAAVRAYQREAGRGGYQNRSWRSHHSSPPPALPQYNHSDAERKGTS